MAQGGIRMVSKNFEKNFLTFLGLGTNVVKVSSVNSELLFQWDTLNFWHWPWGPSWWCGILLCLIDLQVLFHPLALSFSFPRTLVVVSLPRFTEGWRGLSSSSNWWRGVQHFPSTGELIWGSSDLCLLLMWHLGCSRFLKGSPERGCLHHGDLFYWNMVEVGRDSPGMVTLAQSLKNPSSGATLSRMVSSEKDTYCSILSLNSRTHLARRHGWPSIGRLDFSTQYCRVWA